LQDVYCTRYLLHAVNEATAAHSAAVTSEMSLTQADNKRAEAEISRRMTVEKAIHTVRHIRHVPYEVVDSMDEDLVQPNLVHISSRQGLRSQGEDGPAVAVATVVVWTRQRLSSMK